jgi:hypothetical protein
LLGFGFLPRIWNNGMVEYWGEALSSDGIYSFFASS